MANNKETRNWLRLLCAVLLNKVSHKYVVKHESVSYYVFADRVSNDTRYGPGNSWFNRFLYNVPLPCHGGRPLYLFVYTAVPWKDSSSNSYKLDKHTHTRWFSRSVVLRFQAEEFFKIINRYFVYKSFCIKFVICVPSIACQSSPNNGRIVRKILPKGSSIPWGASLNTVSINILNY